ncbi:hypothetical protein BH23GEM2_BH23GEM2_21500 [soil metagenome]
MRNATTICIAAAGLWACAPAFGGRQAAPCTVECALELTNGTTLDLDIRVTQRAIGAVVHEHLGPGETRRIPLGSSEIPVVAVQGARSAWMTRPLTVSVKVCGPHAQWRQLQERLPARVGGSSARRLRTRWAGERASPMKKPRDS